MEKKHKLLKIEPSDYKIIIDNAKKFTGGNVTAWIIYASTVHAPSEKELVNE